MEMWGDDTFEADGRISEYDDISERYDMNSWKPG